MEIHTVTNLTCESSRRTSILAGPEEGKYILAGGILYDQDKQPPSWQWKSFAQVARPPDCEGHKEETGGLANPNLFLALSVKQWCETKVLTNHCTLPGFMSRSTVTHFSCVVESKKAECLHTKTQRGLLFIPSLKSDNSLMQSNHTQEKRKRKTCFLGIRQSKVQGENANVLKQEINWAIKQFKEGVPQSVFSCSKESGRHTPYFGPQSFKQIPEELQVQNADA